MAGMRCYGGLPIEPPCTNANFPPDKEISEIVDELIERICRYKKAEEKRLAKEIKKKERIKKATETRRKMRLFCIDEINNIKHIKRQIKELEKLHNIIKNYSDTVSIVNQLFQYEDQSYYANKKIDEIENSINELKLKLSKTEQDYALKKSEFKKRQKGSESQ